MMADRRILLAGIQHETNGFSNLRTTLADFRSYQYAEGSAIIERYAGSGTEIGGMIRGAAAAGLELVPTLFTFAMPAGLVEAGAFEKLLGVIEHHARPLAPFDGALVVLHGAMDVAGREDADAGVVRFVRGFLAPNAPVVATLDYHANISQGLVDAADVLVGYDTFPHSDFFERGEEAASILGRLLDGMERPAKAFRKLPLLPATVKQATTAPPMARILAAAHAAEGRPGVLTCTVAAGYTYGDVPHLGAAVLAYGEAAAATAAADQVAGLLWGARSELRADLVAPDEAVARAMRAGRGPVVLVDAADNLGGGAPGDGTVLLAELLRQQAQGALVVLWDPEAVEAAAGVGVGGRFIGAIGAKADRHHGTPVPVEGDVRFVGPKTYVRDGSYMKGTRVDMGHVAVLRVQGTTIVLTSLRVPPFDATHLRCLGLDPAAQQILVVKSAAAWRGAFGDVVADAILTDTPGICSQRPDRLPYSRLRRPVYPIDPAVVWTHS
jgi:microcystin degradation protein MlrC